MGLREGRSKATCEGRGLIQDSLFILGCGDIWIARVGVIQIALYVRLRSQHSQYHASTSYRPRAGKTTVLGLVLSDQVHGTHAWQGNNVMPLIFTISVLQ